MLFKIDNLKCAGRVSWIGGGTEMHTGWRNLKERDSSFVRRPPGCEIQRTLKKQSGRVWSGFI